ncbi:MAG: DUF4398 domain-containing protein [Steroidobacteraceae bacterium]
MRISENCFRSRIAAGCLMLMAVLIGACASNPPAEVVAKLTRAETSVSQAEQSGAAQGALSELQMAKDGLANAKKYFDEHDYEKAGKLAERAQLDAQYAAARASSIQSGRAADEVQESIRALQKESGMAGSKDVDSGSP